MPVSETAIRYQLPEARTEEFEYERWEKEDRLEKTSKQVISHWILLSRVITTKNSSFLTLEAQLLNP